MLHSGLVAGRTYATLSLRIGDGPDGVGRWSPLPRISGLAELLCVSELALACGEAAIVAFDERRPDYYVAAAMVSSRMAGLHLLVHGERLLADPSIPGMCRQSMTDGGFLAELTRDPATGRHDESSPTTTVRSGIHVS